MLAADTHERGGALMNEPQDLEGTTTLTDAEIETRRLGRSGPVGSAHDTSDTGDDTGDTGDDTGDPSDPSDTGDDSGDVSDTGDDSGDSRSVA
jgi:hypothetical protein